MPRRQRTTCEKGRWELGFFGLESFIYRSVVEHARQSPECVPRRGIASDSSNPEGRSVIMVT